MFRRYRIVTTQCGRYDLQEAEDIYDLTFWQWYSVGIHNTIKECEEYIDQLKSKPPALKIKVVGYYK